MNKKTKQYLGFETYGRDLNLETKDIKGAISLDHYSKLEHKIITARQPDQTTISNVKTDQSQKPETKIQTKKITNEYIEIQQTKIKSSPIDEKKPNQNINKKAVDIDHPQNKVPVSSMIVDVNPSYKYIGKKEKNTLVDKADARLDVADINNKKTRYQDLMQPNSEKEQLRLNHIQHLRNLDVHKPEILFQPIEHQIVYKNGHRYNVLPVAVSKESEARIAPFMRTTVYDYPNQAFKGIDADRTLKQQEAKIFMKNNPVILRNLDGENKGNNFKKK